MTGQGLPPWQRRIPTETRVLWATGSLAACVAAHALSWLVAMGAVDIIAPEHSDFTGCVVIAVALAPLLFLVEVVIAIVASWRTATFPGGWLFLWMSAVLVTAHLALLIAWRFR